MKSPSLGKASKMILVDFNEYRNLLSGSRNESTRFDQDRARVFADDRLSINDKVNIDSYLMRNNNRVRQEAQKQQDDEISKIIEKLKSFSINARSNQRDIGVGDYFARTNDAGVGNHVETRDVEVGGYLPSPPATPKTNSERRSRGDYSRNSELDRNERSSRHFSPSPVRPPPVIQSTPQDVETPVKQRKKKRQPSPRASPFNLRTRTWSMPSKTQTKSKRKKNEQSGSGLTLMRGSSGGGGGSELTTDVGWRWLQMKFY